MIWIHLLLMPIRREGVYCLLFSADRQSSYFLPVPGEDIGKEEGTRLEKGRLVSLTSSSLGVISGSVEFGEPYDLAVSREGLEEQDLYIPPSAISNSLPTVTVSRSKNGKLSHFDAVGHSTILTPDQLLQLKQRTPVLEIPNEGIERFLNDYKELLRPHINLAYKLLLKHRRLQ